MNHKNTEIGRNCEKKIKMIIRQLTNNNYTDYDPRISGKNITWTGFGEPNPSQFEVNAEAEIFFYNGSEIRQLTDNNFADRRPDISGNNIAWQSGLEPFKPYNVSPNISFFDGNQIIDITGEFGFINNNFAPQISGDNIVWQQGEGNNSEIFAFNGSQIIQVTDNDFADEEPQISEDNIVWTARGEIFTANIADVDNQSLIPME